MRKGKPVSMADLKPMPDNPRSILPDAKRALSESLRQFGDVGCIVWNSRKGREHVVCGHARLDALKTLYGDKLKVEGGAVVTPTGERFRIRIVDWDEKTERLANLAANSEFLQGEWQEEKAQAILTDLAEKSLEAFRSLRLDELCSQLKIELPGACMTGSEASKPEVAFSREIDEASQYVVLLFSNSVDWLNGLSILGLQPVACRYLGSKVHRIALGRAIDGPEAVRRIQKAGRNE